MSFIVRMRDFERASRTGVPAVVSRNVDVASATHKAYLHGRSPSFVICHYQQAGSTAAQSCRTWQ